MTSVTFTARMEDSESESERPRPDVCALQIKLVSDVDISTTVWNDSPVRASGAVTESVSPELNPATSIRRNPTQHNITLKHEWTRRI